MRLAHLLAPAVGLALVAPVSAFIGFGIQMYQPSCAYACRSVIGSAPLACSTDDHAGGGHHGGGGGTTPACRANDTAFLTTLAYCIHERCTSYNIDNWRLEKYWAENAVGRWEPIPPKWTFGEALAAVDKMPDTELAHHGTLNFTAKVGEEDWYAEKVSAELFEHWETLHSTYGISLLVFMFSVPIVLTLMDKLPFMTSLVERLSPLFVTPALIKTFHVRPLPWLVGNAPTRGQALCILVFTVLNIAFMFAGLKTSDPNTWFVSSYEQRLAFVSARTGALAFALLPVTILFAGRNNLLLWFSNWSHDTFVLLHRWVARLLTLQIILHSIIELRLYIVQGTYKEELVQEYWIWGCVGTVVCCIMVIISTLWFRRKSYEIFLVAHILLAAFLLIGSWYHIELLFTRKWGYEMWLYAACAVWFVDRVLRVLRVLKVGNKHAIVTEVAEGVVRVEVPGVRWTPAPGRHAYAYWPGLAGFRMWENHPFSIIPASYLTPTGPGAVSDSSSEDVKDIENDGTPHLSVKPVASSSGVVFYVRKATGMTARLPSSGRVLTWLEGPYHNTSSSAVLTTDRLLLIGGGIGVTGLVPFLRAHGNAKLYWSLKEKDEGLMHDLGPALRDVEQDIRINSRLDVRELLEDEGAKGWGRIGVVVCGPGGLCDDVRDVVTRLGRSYGGKWELDVEAFSW